MKNAVVSYRDKPLEQAEFEKLDSLARQKITFKPRLIAKVVVEADEYGDKIERKYLIEAAPELFLKDEISPALIDSLRRAAPAKSTIIHFSRLAAHKPWGRGNESWSFVMEDLCKDLDGISDYAVILACQHFRQKTGMTFFPDTADLQKYIRDLDFSLRNLKSESSKNEPAPVDEFKKPSAKQKRRNLRILKLATKPKANWTKWECRFFEATRRQP